MPEYVTKSLDRNALLALVQDFAEAALRTGTGPLSVSYGWDCGLEIEEMWKPIEVQPSDLTATLLRSEVQGILNIGCADVFIEAGEVRLQLCHESDAHLEGCGTLFQDQLLEWRDRGYEPTLTPKHPQREASIPSGHGSSGA